MSSKRPYYIKSELVPVEEDLFHEFKGHRSFSQEEVPQVAVINRTRRAISKNFCGFLNTGLGGTVYCGILDNGEVGGIGLTPFQKDHILLTLQDLFSRYNPPVGPDMYTCRFVPVFHREEEVIEISDNLALNNPERNKPHLMRKAMYCWCDKDGFAQQDLGILPQAYVIEVEIFPWNPKNKLSLTKKTPIHPLFYNEEGIPYIRRLSGVHQLSLQEVIQLAEAETMRYHSVNHK